MEIREKHLQVSKTARYYQIGQTGPQTKRLWYVLHGYGQLASFFIKHFEAIADQSTVVIAPEALSRFYNDGLAGRVGATWMTKEDRLNEIEDYVAYLDRLHQQTTEGLPQNLEIVLLGFSQGTATAWRWLKKGNIRVDHLVNWAGGIPVEMKADWASRLNKTRLYTVVGDQDQFISPENADKQIQALKVIKPDLLDFRFHGEHRMDRQTLLSLNEQVVKQ